MSGDSRPSANAAIHDIAQAVDSLSVALRLWLGGVATKPKPALPDTAYQKLQATSRAVTDLEFALAGFDLLGVATTPHGTKVPEPSATRALIALADALLFAADLSTRDGKPPRELRRAPGAWTRTVPHREVVGPIAKALAVFVKEELTTSEVDTLRAESLLELQRLDLHPTSADRALIWSDKKLLKTVRQMLEKLLEFQTDDPDRYIVREDFATASGYKSTRRNQVVAALVRQGLVEKGDRGFRLSRFGEHALDKHE
ncbi:MAG: hypothetical protein KDB80_11375 [Planctomycetes bacterium]|nr:hypothetical protein [Planctomycetota bacterium]